MSDLLDRTHAATVSAVGRSRPTTIEPPHDMDRSATPAAHPDECALSTEQQYSRSPSGYTLGIPAFAPPNYYVASPTTKISNKIYTTELAKPLYPSESPRLPLEPSPSPKNHSFTIMSADQAQTGKRLVPSNIKSYLENKEPLYQNENPHKVYELMTPQKFSKPNNSAATRPIEPIKNLHPPVKATKSSDTSQLVQSSPDVKEEKKKKWTLGGLFRRRKKDSETESSSQEDEPRKGFLARRRSRREKRKQRANKSTMGFDHIVKQPDRSEAAKDRGRTGANPGDTTVSTDCLIKTPATDVLRVKAVSKDSLVGSHDSRSSRHQDSSLSRNSSGGSGSLEGLSRRERLGIIKARAEALRQKGSSSDEDPNNVDNSLHRSGSVNRRSRYARTERYIKRLSRDEESILHREAMEKQRLCKSDAEGPYAVSTKWLPSTQEGSDYDPRYVVTSATPSPGQSPLVRHKNVHYTNSAPITSVSNPASLDRKNYQSQSVRLPKCYSVRGQSPLPPTCDQKLSQRHPPYENFHHPGQRSFSYDNNIHRVTNLGTPPANENVMVVQFPVGRISQFQNRVGDTTGRSSVYVGAKPGPPPPPPRDPQRLISSSNCLFADSTRPMSYAFEDGSQALVHPSFQKQHGSFISLNSQPAAAPITVGSRSTSENQIINQMNSFPRQQVRPRPASVTPEAMKPLPGGRYNVVDPTMKAQFQYYADQTPRSRKPIHIQYHPDQPYLSDSQVIVIKPPQSRNHPVSQVTEFWRQKEQDNNLSNLKVRRNSGVRLPRSDRSRSPSPHLKDSQESPRLKHRGLAPLRPTDSLSSLSGHSDVSSPMKSSDIHDSYESLGGVPNTDSLRRKDQRPLSMVLESHEQMSLFPDASKAVSPQEVSPKMKFMQDILPNKGTALGNLTKLRSVQENAPISKAAMDGLPRTRSTQENASKTRVTPKYIPRSVSLQDGKLELARDSLPKPKPLEARIPKFMLPAEDYTSTPPIIKPALNESTPASQPILQEEHTAVLSPSKNVPPTPPVRRFSRQLSGSSVEAVEMTEVEVEPRSRKSSNLEDALDELEAIYQSLKLGDEDLLDRAERRDLPTQFQRRDSIQDSFTGLTRGSMSDSGYSYEMPIVEMRKRAPPNRRSGVPDKVMDDMAYRRLHPKDRPNSQNIISQAGSFILASPVLSQASSVNQGLDLAHLKTSNQEPDTTYDDVVYRNIRHVNNSLKCLDPQPPFGIPLGPVAASPDSDYLRVKPSQRYRPTFRPRRTPDVVADDLAYRNLRKDSPTKDVAVVAATEDPSPNTARLKDNNFSLRRRRAVRSLSANLPSLIGRDNLTIVNLNVSDRDFEKAQSLTHLPDALEIAQKILEGKEVIGGGSTLLYGSPQLEACRRTERVNNNADRSSLCTTSTSTETLTDSRANLTLFQDSVNKRNSWQQKLRVNIPNNETNLQRPPPPSTPERRNLDDNLLSPTGSNNSILSTDRLFNLADKTAGVPSFAGDDSMPLPDSVPGSPLDEAQLEDLLSALAREARVTSAQLGVQLAGLKKPATSAQEAVVRSAESGVRLVGLKKPATGAQEDVVRAAEGGGQLAHEQEVADETQFAVEPLHIYEPNDVRELEATPHEGGDLPAKGVVGKRVSELHLTLVHDADPQDSLMLEVNNNNNAAMTDDSLNGDCEPEDMAETINKMLSKSRERNHELPDTFPLKPKRADAEPSVADAGGSASDAAKGDWHHYTSTEGECSGDELPGRPVRIQTLSVPCGARRLRAPAETRSPDNADMSDRRLTDLSTSGSSDNCMIPTEKLRQRAERIATYKEARRKQLASQFASISDSQSPTTKRFISRSAATRANDDDTAAATPSSSESGSQVRTTRTSRLRAATASDAPPSSKAKPSPARTREADSPVAPAPRKPAVPRLSVRSKEDSPPKKTSHSSSPQRKTSHSDSPQRKSSHSDSPRRKTSHSDSPQRKTSLSDSPRRKTSHSDSPQRKVSSHSDSPQRKVSAHSDSPHRKTSHSDSPRSKPSHSESPQRQLSSNSRVSPARSTESTGSTGSLKRTTRQGSPRIATPKTNGSSREAARSSSRGRDPGASPSSRRGSDGGSRRLTTPSARAGSSEKEKSPLSSGGSSASLKSPRPDKDKSSKRKSNLNRALATEEVEDNTVPDDGAIRRRPRRLDASPTPRSSPFVRRSPDTALSPGKGAFDVVRKEVTKTDYVSRLGRGPAPPSSRLANNIADATPPPSSASSVTDRVQLLTAITRQTVERLEQLNGCNGDPVMTYPPPEEVGPSDFPVVESCEIFKPSKPSSILKKTSFDEPHPAPPPPPSPQAPVSILKRKTSNEESAPSPPVTFSPTVVEQTRGRNSQGILKKRCSLDESEVMRRRSCSPDVTGESKPILKRRSSLEELVRRAQSPDPQSILKRRPSREDDLDERSSSPEPHGILKRKMATATPPSHISIATAVMMSAAGMDPADLDADHVRPILKKKSSSEDYTTADSSSDTPRPILKKKVSVDYADDQEDRPKKTILKTSRKSSQEESYSSSGEGGRGVGGRDSAAYREVESPVRFQQTQARSHGNNDRYPGADRDEGRYLGTHRDAGAGDRESPKRFDTSDKEGRYLKSSSPKLQAATSAVEGNYLKNRGLREDSPSSSDCEVKPILKTAERTSPKHRLSFNGDDGVVMRRRLKSSDNESTSSVDTELQTIFLRRRSRESSPEPLETGVGPADRQRPLSVAERIQNMEQYFQVEGEVLSPTGAVPKRVTPLRGRDKTRFSTQPITLSDFNGISVSSELDAAPGSPTGEADVADMDARGAAGGGAMLKQMKAMAEEAQARRNQKAVRLRDLHRLDKEERFQTQPVTLDEVQQAVMLNQKQNDALEAEMTQEPPDDDADPSKLSLAERVRLFNQKSQQKDPVPPPAPRKRSARFRTQPVTLDEIGTAQQRVSPLAAAFVKPPDPELLGTMSARAAREKMFEHAQQSLKSILKPGVTVERKKTPSPVVARQLRSVLKRDDEPVISETELPRSILKPASDHRSSTSEESSESEVEPRRHDDLVSILEAHAGKVVQSAGDGRPPLLSSSADTGTSDGESSGGREVKRIIRNEAVARRRQAAINKHKDRNSAPLGALTKSHSQTTVTGQDDAPAAALPLRRSMTQPMDDVQEEVVKGNASIAERLAALKKSGTTGWQKRVPKLKAEDDLTVVTVNNLLNAALRPPPDDGGGGGRILVLDRIPTPEDSTLVADRREKLETAAQGWKKRVGPTDAVNFSVMGRMLKESSCTELPASPLASPTERQKRTPRPNRFRSKTARADEVKSMPTSPQKEPREALSFKRSVSAPGGDEENGLDDNVTRVCVPRFNDETYTTFFQSVTESVSTDHLTEIKDEDLEHLETQSTQLVIQRRTVKKSTRKAAASRNPVKTLAARTDLQEEYVEIKTGVAEKELKKLKVEQFSKQSTLAVEALAGLASTEDFTAVSLKKAVGSPYGSAMLPFKELMLLHIKGRRHVQTRLVEPCAASINSGDNYVLVTPTEVFNWVGLYSNVIERARGAEIASLIHQRKDLGCSAPGVTTIAEGGKGGACPRARVDAFWRLLGGSAATPPTPPGHPDEDELFEGSIVATNMVYAVSGDELVPVDESWGAIPRIELLDPARSLVLDFGSELYVWSGKNASMETRRVALSLAQEMWDQGYDYSECDVSPLGAAGRLGARGDLPPPVTSGVARPPWALLAKVNQHMETVLFREKFLDWPDFSRVIRAKGGDDGERGAEGSIEVKPCDAREMFETRLPEPDLELEGSHLGRGTQYLDEESGRHYEIATQSVTVWHILEYEHATVPAVSLGQFHAGDSYVVRWLYTMTVTGRELNGRPSRHSMVGRDRCAYFCWQGSEASLNEQGAAALLTVELDHERGPQARVVQGSEPPAFLNLFQGGMVVHAGRRHEGRKGSWRLYVCRGEAESEAVLTEVACSVRQLRSRASLVLLNTTAGALYVWHGCKATPHTRRVARAAADKLKARRPEETGLEVNARVVVREVEEGGEMNDFLEGLGGGKGQLYHSLCNQAAPADHTPRLFHLSSVSGSFASTEIASPYRTDKVTVAFPFLQSDLYSASQPTLFLLDNGSELWLWQGWWPEREEAGERGADATGSGSVRWQAERRAAMQTALDYWRLPTKPRAYLVWAGLEPLTFTNLFPMWTDRDDVAELNIRDGRKPGEVLMVEGELARLTRSTYPAAQLLQRPLPDGVDPTRLELYLDPQHFQELLGTTKEEFEELPTWKQTKIKKEAGLF